MRRGLLTLNLHVLCNLLLITMLGCSKSLLLAPGTSSFKGRPYATAMPEVLHLFIFCFLLATRTEVIVKLMAWLSSFVHRSIRSSVCNGYLVAKLQIIGENILHMCETRACKILAICCRENIFRLEVE